MKIILLIIGLIAGLNSLGQNTFEGKIIMSTTYSGEGSEELVAFAPTGQTFHLGKGAARYEMVGGMMASMMGPIVVLESGESYMIKDNEETVYMMSDDEAEEQADPTIVQTNLTQVILGYTCTKYIVTTKTEEGGEATQSVWATDKIVTSSNGKGGIGQKGIIGFPLKTETTMDMMGMKITTTTLATEIVVGEQKASLFSYPSYYEVKDLDVETFMGR